MKKFILLLLSVLGLSTGMSAQELSDGYYRVTNANTDRYIHVIDNKGSLNVSTTSADMGAITLKKGIDLSVSDPASVLYVEKHGTQYDIRAQSTGIYAIIGVYVNLIKSPKVANAYMAYGKKGNVVMYLYDAKTSTTAIESYLDTKGQDENRNWYVKPIDNSTENYFGVQPTHQANGKYYAAFYASFPFSCASSGMKVYYIKTVDANQGVAVYKEITGTVPALTPVIIECSSNNPADNKLTLGGSASAISDNQGKGVLFNSDKYKHENFVAYNKSTMRTIGLAADGSLAMTAADYANVPMNTFYIPVAASCPANLKLVHESQYQAGPVEATAITLSQNSLALNVGASASLTATVAPDNTTDKTVTWTSSNPAVASVDAAGNVRALTAGSATITATCGKVSASCSVTVSNIEATAITLNQTSLALNVGASASLTATVAPDNTTIKTVTWASSNTSVATVDAAGNVRAIAAGSATITATCGKVSASCAVTVSNVEATAITLNHTSLALSVGASASLTATVAPDNTTFKTVTWTSSNTSVASVDAAGNVRALTAGSTTITATCGQVSASCAVTVSNVEASEIVLSALSMQLNIGDRGMLSATVMPVNTTDKTVTWTSSDPAVATVSANGMVTAIAEGSTIITASCGTATASCTVTVTPLKAASITLNVSELVIKIGYSETLTATVLPAEVADKIVTWTSSDPTVAEVSHTGVVTAVSVGSAVIKAEVDGLQAECAVTVVPVEAETITLNAYDIEIIVPQTYQLSATVLPDDTTDKTVIWTSSDTAIATVDTEGLVKAIAEGNVIITASCGEATAQCSVKVLPLDGIHDIVADGEAFDVYTIQGIKIRTQVTSIDDLPHGFYIINGHTIRH